MRILPLAFAGLLSPLSGRDVSDKYTHGQSQPHALVYRGPAACNGCPEAVAHLLRTSPSKFTVTYVGPKEKVQITREALKTADAFAQPGGGGISRTWPEMKPYDQLIRNYVSGGGRYLGFCLGAYFGGTPGYNFLPDGSQTYQESTQRGAQVKNSSNTIIQVNWHFQHGKRAGQVAKNRWMFFQDGAVIKLRNHPNATIFGFYSSNNNVAASLTQFGHGWVGLTGPHPEARKGWYTPYHLKNPDGINFDLGYDFVETVLSRGKKIDA